MQPFHPPTTSTTRPATPDSPSFQKESHTGSHIAAQRAKDQGDADVREYEVKRDRINQGLESVKQLVADNLNCNKHNYGFKYPHIKSAEATSSSRPGLARRSMTYADEPSSIAPRQILLEHKPARQALKRGLTSAVPIPDYNVDPLAEDDDDTFSILKLDLNMGYDRDTATVMDHLERRSIAQLLSRRFEAALGHLDALQKRIHDPQSRVLVTGDLNAGKSTLVNALLRRNEVMPTDQQPLTTRFVEVLSAKETGGQEEIHVLDGDNKYDINDVTTYKVMSIDKLEEMVTDLDSDANSPALRVYLREAADDLVHPSILHNGVVDISLIDAPGLNRDSVKTTANFARQEEIDVVVFCVSAANHFTLSAKDFIIQAGHEKSHLFIVVNRFDTIRDKERCRRMVLEQIRQLSPETYEDAADLVHFVDSAKVAFGCSEDEPGSDVLDQAFAHLEQSLRSFVLVNRAKSKLGPAQNYVYRLLADVELLAGANLISLAQERDDAKAAIQLVKPVLDQLRRGKAGLEEALTEEEEGVTSKVAEASRMRFEQGLERVAAGQLAATDSGVKTPIYTGILGVWDYATEWRKAMVESLDRVVSLAEDDARRLTAEGVKIVEQLGATHLPSDIQRPDRMFNPKAMFTSRAGVSQVGLGLSHRLDTQVSDVIDLHHYFFVAKSALPQRTSSSQELVPYMPDVTGFGAASLVVGAFTLGGKALGMRSIIEGVVRLSDLASNPTARSLVMPVLAVVSCGAVAYLVYDLPQAIPRNIGRHLQATLSPADTSDSFVANQSTRVAKESRKVMRLAAYDLREKYKGAVDVRMDSVKQNELTLKRAMETTAFFEGVNTRIESIREVIGVKVQ